MAKAADVYFKMDPWRIVEEGFDPAYSRVSESVFSLANETTGVRGFFDEGGSADSLRGAYLNGVYDIETIPRSYKGIIDHTHFMIPAADWLMTDITVDGERLDLGRVSFRDFRRELDMRTGVLTRSFVWRTASGKELRLTFLRFTDMTHRERAYQRIVLEALNFSGEAALTSGLSFDVTHEGYQKCYWNGVRGEAGPGRLTLQARTLRSGQEVFAGAALDVEVKDNKLKLNYKTLSYGIHLFDFDNSEGEYFILYVPKGTSLKKADIDVESGSFKLSGIDVEDFKIENESGSIKISDMKSEESSIKAESGTVKIENFETEKLDLVNEFGSVSIDNATTQKTKIKMESGSLKMNGIDMSDAEIKSEFGSVSIILKGSEADYSFKIENEFGSIKLGDKSVGGNDEEKEYEGGSGSKKINIKGESGSIKIDFAD